METMSKLRTLLTNLCRTRRVERELDDEVRAYVDLLANEKVQAGMSMADARRAALMEAGGVEHLKEEVREVRPGHLLQNLLADLRYGQRMLWKNPGVTVVVVVSLALGIGANASIFSALNSILLRPLPYKDPGQLAMVWLDNRLLGLHEDLTSYPNFVDWRSQNRVFQEMAGFTPQDYSITGGEEPMRVDGAMGDAQFFPVLGVNPAMGRFFTQEETQPGHDSVVILSDGLWRTRFGADPNILGKSIELNNAPRTVVGVMPPGFHFPNKDTQIWTPLAVPERTKAARGGFWMRVIGRLKPGVTLEQARAEMSTIGSRLESQYPDTNRGYGAYVNPLLTQVVGNLRLVLFVLSGAVLFVLLIACANVANLLLARGASREREMALRAAVGAGRGRLVTQLLTEGLVLSIGAGLLGFLLAYWGIHVLPRFAPPDLPRLDEIAIDGRVLAFTAVVSIASALVFGLAPAWKVSRVDLTETLREGGRSVTGGVQSKTMRSMLLFAEVALSVVLLTGAGLMVRSLLALNRVNPGFRPEGVITMHVSVPRTKYPEGKQAGTFFESMLARIQSVGGVQSAGLISDIFLSSTPNSGGFTVENHPLPPPEQRIEATVDNVSPGYFAAMGTPLIKGRFFGDQDRSDGLQVAMINETMAKRFWPGEDPVGRRFRFGWEGSTAPWLTVVGVIGDMRRQGLEKQARSETFRPLSQRASRGLNLVVRVSGDPTRLAGVVRGEIRAMEKSAVIDHVRTLQDQIGESLSQRRFETLLLAVLAGVALLLAAVGIYGLVYYSVSQRTHELGVRLALGARTGNLLGMVILQALSIVGIGAMVGALASLALTRALSSMLYEVSPSDPVTLITVLFALGLSAALASYVPARLATKVDPMVALRYE